MTPSQQKNTKRSIVVASNRLPFTYQRTSEGLERRPSVGGLVAALDPVLRKRGGTWVGWPGIEMDADEILPSADEGYSVSPVLLSEAEIQRFYHGFSNRTLWPLMHSMPARAKFESREWEVFKRVNNRFGETLAAESADAGLVWVHDYQLMLAPARVRQELPNTRLAFFLHIPFPPYDIFRLLPWDREILVALLTCDLIGFHVRSYAHNFLDCVQRILGARVRRDEMVVEYGDRTTRVGAFPLGIEYGTFESLALAASRQPETQKETVVLGVDRLDYTKGIPERIHAFERLLERYPEHHENVALLQVAVPSRSQVSEYRELKREIDEQVGRVNGRFATASWSPIRYLYRSITPKRLAALYRDAHVALITPIRDGMNLVAKEFVACQVGDPGVLILSRLAGAADTMREALLVNPYDIEGSADALHRALTMEEEERRSRMTALRRRERRDDVDSWVASFTKAATAARASMVPFTDEDFTGWLGDYMKGYRLALFLDYDGTLTPLREHPSKATLTRSMRATLEALADRPDTDVAIVSGRALDDVRSMVKYRELTYAGNHGLEIEGPDFPGFVHEDLIHYRERSEELLRDLEKIAVDGAWTEAKGPTLTYHYRAVPEKRRSAFIREAHQIISRAGYQPRDAQCAVEARPPIGWDKGRAVLHILRQRYGPSWSEEVRVIYVGDDQTDEDAFRFLAGLSQTFRVGSANTPTAASRRLADVNGVRSLLEWLARRSGSN
ncbi:MAG: bifunctional alpha,alpha-trehalose-phosphate synthase (UDP-forming)/trehalose-phosphatase [Myxococcales bacterium]|nr:bifunctional alpha,alpha-trehalose-phosphate synthase (UDP-forming)/trehalose-phosphatase [Myxococcales bacterium]